MGRSIRTATLNKQKLERQVALLKNRVKEAHARNDAEGLNIALKDVVANLNAQRSFARMESQLSSLRSRVDLMHAQSGMQEALAGASKVLASMNRLVGFDPKSLQTFQYEQARLDVQSEMIEDLLSDVLDGDAAAPDDEARRQYLQVLNEMGIEPPVELARGEAASRVQ